MAKNSFESMWVGIFKSIQWTPWIKIWKSWKDVKKKTQQHSFYDVIISIHMMYKAGRLWCHFFTESGEMCLCVKMMQSLLPVILSSKNPLSRHHMTSLSSFHIYSCLYIFIYIIYIYTYYIILAYICTLIIVTTSLRWTIEKKDSSQHWQ